MWGGGAGQFYDQVVLSKRTTSKLKRTTERREGKGRDDKRKQKIEVGPAVSPATS